MPLTCVQWQVIWSQPWSYLFRKLVNGVFDLQAERFLHKGSNTNKKMYIKIAWDQMHQIVFKSTTYTLIQY